jgi:hypothetical protein
VTRTKVHPRRRALARMAALGVRDPTLDSARLTRAVRQALPLGGTTENEMCVARRAYRLGKAARAAALGGHVLNVVGNAIHSRLPAACVDAIHAALLNAGLPGLPLGKARGTQHTVARALAYIAARDAGASKIQAQADAGWASYAHAAALDTYRELIRGGASMTEIQDRLRGRGLSCRVISSLFGASLGCVGSTP